MGCGKRREATAPIQSLVKLQPCFLRLRWKTCLQQKCSLGSCVCSEGPALGQDSDDDEYVINPLAINTRLVDYLHLIALLCIKLPLDGRNIFAEIYADNTLVECCQQCGAMLSNMSRITASVVPYCRQYFRENSSPRWLRW